MGRIFFWFVGRFILFLLAISFAFLLAISVALTGNARAETPEQYRKFEIRTCIFPPGVPSTWAKWAAYPNGTLAVQKEGEFYTYLPKGAWIYIFDPNAPGCRDGKPIPKPDPAATPGSPTGTLGASPSNGPKGDGNGRKQADAEARTKAQKAAAKEAERKKAEEAEQQRRDAAQEAEERKREEAEETEERKREEAEHKAEADKNEREARERQKADDDFRKRNSPAARYARGETDLPPAEQHGLPKVCRPIKEGGKSPITSLGVECIEGEYQQLPKDALPLASENPVLPNAKDHPALPTVRKAEPGHPVPPTAICGKCGPVEIETAQIEPPPPPPREPSEVPYVDVPKEGQVPVVAASGDDSPQPNGATGEPTAGSTPRWVNLSDVAKPPVATSDECTVAPEDGELTDESCPPPKPPKTLSEYMRSEAALAAAMLTLNLNVELPKDGSRNGIVGGLNRDGIDLPAAQVAMIAVTLGLEVVSFTGQFNKVLKKAIKAGKQLFVKQSSPLARAFAEELAEKYGLHLADAMRANKTIMPYELGQRITARLGNRLQAHHLIEEYLFRDMDALKNLGLNPNLSPSVLLTEAEHRALHRELAKFGKPKSIEELLKLYETAYAANPNWIEAVKWFLGR